MSAVAREEPQLAYSEGKFRSILQSSHFGILQKGLEDALEQVLAAMEKQ